MTLYELALERGELVSENMLHIERANRVYLFVWIRHAPKSRTNQAFLGAGVVGLDRKTWQVLAECVSGTFAVHLDADPCLPILKHAATRISWGLRELPKGKLDLFSVLKEKEQTELDRCIVDLTFEKLVRYIENEWAMTDWVDVSPVALYTLYLLMQREADRQSIACEFCGLHAKTLERVDDTLSRGGSVTRADIESFINSDTRKRVPIQ
jgi:hypothetical protein